MSRAPPVPALELAGAEGQEFTVVCFSNLEAVELFLNGVSLGKKTCRATATRMEGRLHAWRA